MNKPLVAWLSVLLLNTSLATVAEPAAQAPPAPSAPAASRPADEHDARDYRFDGTISRRVLENYLSRSISMEGLLNGRGDLDDNIRMLKATGAKFAGRALCLWGNEANILRSLERAREQAP